MPRSIIRTILAAVAEPAARSQPVIERAVQLARASDAALILFHAAFEASLSGGRLLESKRLAMARGALVAERQRAMEAQAARIRATGVACEVRVVWEEPAHEAIIRAALRDDVDLVIAGPHRSRRERRLRLTDWELLRACPRALLLLRSNQPVEQGPVLVALDPTHASDKPATLDTALARQGARLSQSLGVSLHAVHCIQRSAYALDENDAASRKRMHDRMQHKLQTLLRRARVRVDAVHVLHGAVEQQVPQLAAQLGAQIIVLGALSRRGLQRFAVGDTAERIIDETTCDLLIVKPDDFKLRLGRTRKEAVIAPA